MQSCFLKTGLLVLSELLNSFLHNATACVVSLWKRILILLMSPEPSLFDIVSFKDNDQQTVAKKLPSLIYSALFTTVTV